MWINSEARALSSDPRIISAIQYATQASIYPPENTASELTTAQTVMISLVYALTHRDLPMIKTLLELSSKVPQIKSSFLSVWLKDDFCFPRGDVAKCLSTLGQLLIDGLQFPWSVAATLASLDVKYRIQECFLEADDTPGQLLLSTLNSQVSEGTQVDFNKEVLSKESQTKLMKYVSFKMRTDQASTGTQAGPIVHDREVLVRPEQSSKAVQTAEGSLTTSPVSHSSRSFPKFAQDPVLRAGAGIRTTPVNTCGPLPLKSRKQVQTSTTNPSTGMGVLEDFLRDELNQFERSPAKTPKSTTSVDFRHSGDTQQKVSDVIGKVVSNMQQDICKGMANEQLYSAIQKNDSRSIVVAINSGADVNDVGVMKKRPLHIAASAGRIEPAIELIHWGADVDSLDTWDETPLFVASVAGHLLMAEVLIAAGANINHRNREGNHPIHVASSAGQLEMVELLLNSGAEVDSRSASLRTPLHHAAQWGHLSVVGLLLDRGADPMVTDKAGRTPLDIATSCQYHQVAEYLHRRGLAISNLFDRKTPRSSYNYS